MNASLEKSSPEQWICLFAKSKEHQSAGRPVQAMMQTDVFFLLAQAIVEIVFSFSSRLTGQAKRLFEHQNVGVSVVLFEDFRHGGDPIVAHPW